MESIIENHKNDEFVHFLKINIFGNEGVGKSSLISLMDNYNDDNFQIQNKLDKSNESIESYNESISLVEQIKKVIIDINEDRNVYFNIYETNLDRYDNIKMNLDTLLFQTECIIIMWDNSNIESFDNIPNLIVTINEGIKQNKFRNVPIFIIQNKIDLKMDLENGEDIEDFKQSIENLKKEYPQIIYKEISLLDKDSAPLILLDIDRKLEIKEKFKFKYPLNININKNKYDNNDNMKILLIGDSKVGKSSFLNYLFEKELNNNNNNKYITSGEINEKKINFELMEENIISNIDKKKYKNIDGIILFFDVTNKYSFKSAIDWILHIKNIFGEINNLYELFIIGNKIDENEKRKILKQEAKNIAKKYKIKYFECSSKIGINVYEILNEIAFMAYDKYYAKYLNKKEEENINPNINPNINQKNNIEYDNNNYINENKENKYDTKIIIIIIGIIMIILSIISYKLIY